MSATPEQIAKLPRWARWHIEKLEKDLASAHRRLDEGTITRVIVDPHNEHPRHLDDRTTVRFVTDSTSGDYLDVTLTDGVVTARARDALAMFPAVSNRVDLRPFRPADRAQLRGDRP